MPWFKCIYGYMYVNIMNRYKGEKNNTKTIDKKKDKKKNDLKKRKKKKRNNYSGDICIRIYGYF